MDGQRVTGTQKRTWGLEQPWGAGEKVVLIYKRGSIGAEGLELHQAEEGERHVRQGEPPCAKAQN